MSKGFITLIWYCRSILFTLPLSTIIQEDKLLNKIAMYTKRVSEGDNKTHVTERTTMSNNKSKTSQRVK